MLLDGARVQLDAVARGAPPSPAAPTSSGTGSSTTSRPCSRGRPRRSVWPSSVELLADGVQCGADLGVQLGPEDVERELRRQRDLQRARRTADGLGGLYRRRLVAVAVDIARRGVEQQRRIGDGAGQHAVDGDAVERLRQRPRRDPAALRLDADQMRPRRGNPDTARAVGPDRGGDQSRRHRGGAAARRTTRSVVARPRVSRVPEGGPTGERPLAQLAGVRLADDDRACGAQPAHDLGVGRRQVRPGPPRRTSSARPRRRRRP